MSKKDLRAVTASLASLASPLPTQNTPHVRPAKLAAVGHGEKIVQFSFGLRKSLRKELAQMAEDTEVTMRAIILNALKEKGLSVTDEDLLDMRKERG